jgi:aldehyde:ferredoxin oxidoreductase
VTNENTNTELLDILLGGRGLADWIIYKELDRHTDPLGPDNVLILSNGLLTGSIAPGSTRLHISGKSPQTGLIGFANIGGNFGATMQKAGFQTILIKERSKQPACIFIQSKKIEIINVKELWGVDTWETERLLKRRFGEDIEIISIGPAGENLVSFASIIHRLLSHLLYIGITTQRQDLEWAR